MKESSPVSSRKLLAFLLEPRSYPHRPKRVVLVQTHASYVLLVAPYVYKVKKPVNFGFLDFSTLENRRYFSEQEVILNQRLCPRIYLGVVPISLNAGKLIWDLEMKSSITPSKCGNSRTVGISEYRPKVGNFWGACCCSGMIDLSFVVVQI
jgi:hypothetical protein